MITCTKHLHFCAGHRVLHHEGKCAHLHGHNYKVAIIAEAAGLDPVGRVIDFSVLKDRIGKWIEENWDHKFLLWDKDIAARTAVLMVNKPEATILLPVNPTAENLAQLLLMEIAPRQMEGTGVRIIRVVVQETESCSAEASL